MLSNKVIVIQTGQSYSQYMFLQMLYPDNKSYIVHNADCTELCWRTKYIINHGVNEEKMIENSIYKALMNKWRTPACLLIATLTELQPSIQIKYSQNRQPISIIGGQSAEMEGAWGLWQFKMVHHAAWQEIKDVFKGHNDYTHLKDLKQQNNTTQRRERLVIFCFSCS